MAEERLSDKMYERIVEQYANHCGKQLAVLGTEVTVNMQKNSDGWWCVSAMRGTKPACVSCGDVDDPTLDNIDVRIALDIPPIFAAICPACKHKFDVNREQLTEKFRRTLN